MLSIEVAYEILKKGDKPKASPCTTLTNFSLSKIIAKSLSFEIILPLYSFPMRPSQEG